MRVSFDLNVRLIVTVAFASTMLWLTWIGVLEPLRFSLSGMMGLIGFGGLTFYWGLKLAGWYFDCALAHHYRCQGMSEDGVRLSVRGFKGTSELMTMRDMKGVRVDDSD